MRCVPQVASLAAAAERGYSDMLLLDVGKEREGGGWCLNVRVVDNACFGLKLSTWNAIFQTVYFLCKFAYISATPPHTLLPLPLSLSLSASPSGDFLQGADSHAVRRLSEEKNGGKTRRTNMQTKCVA